MKRGDYAQTNKAIHPCTHLHVQDTTPFALPAKALDVYPKHSIQPYKPQI